MAKLALLLELTRHQNKQKARREQHSPRDSAGYTLLELLVAILIVGIIAAIGAPGWLSFTNQRRVGKANDVIFNALQEAQSQAKNRKLSYSVAFRNSAGKVPEVAVYPTKQTDPSDSSKTIDVDPTKLPKSNWRSLGQELALKPGQVTLGTNIDTENAKTGNVSYNLSNDADIAKKKITFDYQGTLPTDTNPKPSLPLIIVVAASKGNTTTDANESTTRCVKVTTLLGGIQTARGKECDPSNQINQ